MTPEQWANLPSDAYGLLQKEPEDEPLTPEQEANWRRNAASLQPWLDNLIEEMHARGEAVRPKEAK